jgi:transposase InsO family protein
MLEPKLPPNRYEFDAPGDMLHVDIKKLARIHKPGHRITGNPQDETRGAGWEFLYVAVDDHSRVAYTAMMPDEKAVSASRFLAQAVRYFAGHKTSIRRVMTDNGPCFISDLFKAQCQRLAIKHKRTKIYTPRTNGKAERCHPRVGLRPPLPELRGEKQLPPSLDQSLQLPQAAC